VCTLAVVGAWRKKNVRGREILSLDTSTDNEQESAIPNVEVYCEELLWALELPAYYRLENVSCRPNTFDVRYLVFHPHHSQLSNAL